MTFTECCTRIILRRRLQEQCIDKTMQNQRIEYWKAEMHDETLQKVATAGFYALIFNEPLHLTGDAKVLNKFNEFLFYNLLFF